MEGNDHKVSLLPSEFKEMVNSIRDLDKALGTHKPRIISQGEMMNREVLAKSLISNRQILEGEIISEKDIDIKSPGNVFLLFLLLDLRLLWEYEILFRDLNNPLDILFQYFLKSLKNLN